MKNLIKNISFLFLAFLMLSCDDDNNSVNQTDDSLKNDKFNYTGTYLWKFNIMGTEQTSSHTFFADSIQYEMKGEVYTVNYTMNKISYDKLQGKWIGETDDKTVYVLFLKDKTDSTVTLYKHKCASNGLQEAIAFDIPADDVTDDHGWNIYTLKGKELPMEVLPIAGNFVNDKHNLLLSDAVVEIDGKKVNKMSFHLGERRWVGKCDDKYLQLFFKSLENTNTIELSLNWFDDVEKLYKVKYNSIKDWQTFTKNSFTIN